MSAAFVAREEKRGKGERRNVANCHMRIAKGIPVFPHYVSTVFSTLSPVY